MSEVKERLIKAINRFVRFVDNLNGPNEKDNKKEQNGGSRARCEDK